MTGDYHTGWDKALKAVGYDDLRKEQAERVEAFKRGERTLLGIGLSHFAESSVRARSRTAISWPRHVRQL